MMSLRRACLYALLPVAAWSSSYNAIADGMVTTSGRTILEDNLAYPVLLVLKGGAAPSMASGFFLNTSKAMYLITANHFLAEQDPFLRDPNTKEYRTDVDISLTSYSSDPFDPKRNAVILNLHTLKTDRHLQVNPAADIVVITMGTVGTPPTDHEPTAVTLVAGVTVKEMATLGTVGVSIEDVKMFDQVLTGNDVIIYDYPTSLGLTSMPQINPDRPLLRRGIVAGKNLQQHTLILDCLTHRGNSGGPIFEVYRDLTQTRFRLIGVADQYVPFATGVIDPAPASAGQSHLGSQRATPPWPAVRMMKNSGYSIATPIDDVVKTVEAVERPSTN